MAQNGYPEGALTTKVSSMLLVLTGTSALTYCMILAMLLVERDSTLMNDSVDAFLD